ncbi:Dps family protein [Pontivivens insulae]|uniref:DNA protection during starvation protein n=1 Tax=Pontivivens insulae TaxID=1639689 RepID=A0A2R8AEW8_9RHOB|nr:ferritin-like domain-containing protein [Pontivivens insulae]RED11892.1 starvation-inducible DNA-binding protein [Pontivivens insulae]SPF30648.1 DNA protection during starvation protein [Pontivivens insulae]
MKDTAHDLNATQKTEVVEGLHQALADLSVTTKKAQFFHWNVTGMSFGSLHALFEEIYNDHFAAQDEVAERIRALGAFTEGSYAEALDRTTVSEAKTVVSAEQMVEDMAVSQETISAALKELAEAATSNGDPLTEDLAIGRAQVHEKFAWILRAHLG